MQVAESGGGGVALPTVGEVAASLGGFVCYFCFSDRNMEGRENLMMKEKRND